MAIVPAPPPALLPLFRSANQLRLLAALLLQPERQFMVSDLATETDVPQPSVSREVAKLLAAGLLIAGRDRGRRVVQANAASPIYPELASILLKTMGPKPVLERALAGLPGIERALIYGSWAHRSSGVPGREPVDIDVLVIGAPDVREVRDRAERASEELGRDVNTSVLTSEEWESAASGFVRELRQAPLVELEVSPSSAT